MLQRIAFVRHYKALRANPLFRDVTILYILENNLGKEHDNIKTIITDKTIFDNNVDYLFETHAAIGFRTKEHTKVTAADLLRQVISIGCISFAEDFVCTNTEAKDGAAGMKSLLLEQLGNLREYTTEKSNGTFKREITGKHDALGAELKGRKDDAQMACFLALLYSRKFLDDQLPVNIEAIENRMFKRIHSAEEPDMMEIYTKRRRIEAEERHTHERTKGLFNRSAATAAAAARNNEDE